MSQRTFTSNNKTALTGWDRPLQYFFLVIEERDRTIYSNLDEANPALSIEKVFEVLSMFGMPVPATLREDLLDDRRGNAGNTVHHYGVVGDAPGLDEGNASAQVGEG
jgi:hypothetical protein